MIRWAKTNHQVKTNTKIHSQLRFGFTIVELVIVISVIAILTTIIVVGYNGVQKSAATASVQADLDRVASSMQLAYSGSGSYPSTIPASFIQSDDTTVQLVYSVSRPFYSGLTSVQNGQLMAQICQDLIDEGVGKGTNQGGVLTSYITGCGNWNHNSMQVTGWDTKVWNTPVSSSQLQNYADTFTTNDDWNKIQETVVKNFYGQLILRQTQEGGHFPIDSFWDSWATPQNGGVMEQPITQVPLQKPYYCIQATSDKFADVIWHVNETAKIISGNCK